jgi:hypothetical protein
MSMVDHQSRAIDQVKYVGIKAWLTRNYREYKKGEEGGRSTRCEERPAVVKGEQGGERQAAAALGERVKGEEASGSTQERRGRWQQKESRAPGRSIQCEERQAAVAVGGRAKGEQVDAA